MSEFLRDALLTLLRRLEWSANGRPYDDGSFAPACPVCDEPKSRGHDEACELSICIRALETEDAA